MALTLGILEALGNEGSFYLKFLFCLRSLNISEEGEGRHTGEESVLIPLEKSFLLALIFYQCSLDVSINLRKVGDTIRS
jgi:hypothetical protein